MILPKLILILTVVLEINARYVDKYCKNELKEYDCCVDYCYTEDKEPYGEFSTKTAYQPALQLHDVIPDCTPVQFWSLNRHGTRYPSEKDMKKLLPLIETQSEILKHYNEHLYPDQGALCQSDLELLKTWQWDDSMNGKGNELTKQGVAELSFIARSFAGRYKELLGQPYSEDVYYFRHTNTNRTYESFQAYATGLFGNNISQVHADVFEKDLLLKATDFCDAWISDVNENPETHREYREYLARPDYQQMMSDLSIRLGYNETFNQSVIDNMYDMCRYEKAWNPQDFSSWCVAFNKDQLKMLEYAEDLKYYYNYGYGNDINARVGCLPVKDLYEKFERRVNGDTSGHQVNVYFTHSDIIQTFLASMGIAKGDEPLTAENYEQQDQRQWRTSVIGTFASNIAAALFECQSGARHRVAFYHNEKPVNYPGCTDGICDWSTVTTLLGNVAESCSLDFCNTINYV